MEISDVEAPDVEDAKRNLRSQAEKKRLKQKKTVVQGVTDDVEVRPETAAVEIIFGAKSPSDENATIAAEPKESYFATADMREETKESARADYKPYEVKLPPIGARPGMVTDKDASEEMARQLQAKFDAEEDDSEEESEDEAEMEARNRRRSRSKKGRRRQKHGDGSASGDLYRNSMDFQVRDNDDIALQPQVFSRDHFGRLIKKTFDDYYPLEYNRSTFNIDEYLAVVAQE